jgi:tetratricopeptide (TPR) repeat protein
MKRATVAALAGFWLVATATAAEQWLKLTSSHFELYTTAGEKKGREAVLYFEQVRDFFGKTRSNPLPNTPVRIIAFRSEKEFNPYRISESAIAFYLNGYDRDYIVMRSITDENYPVTVHEYTHLLVEHSGIELPIWLNEGLAELYSTLKPMGKKVAIGQVIPGRYYFLRQNKWLPLETLTTVSHDSPYYNERNRAGIFYAESWALAHMLFLSPAYRPQVNKFLLSIASGVSSGNAFWQVYAKTTAQVEKDLEQYMRGTQFNAVVFDVKLEKSAEQPEVEPAPPLESGTVLADLLALTGKRQPAKEAYEKLAKDFPQSWQPEAGLAELNRRMENPEEARRHFARAAELGSTNPRLYYAYAMVLREVKEKESSAIPLLEKAVQLDPGYQDAQRYLAFCLVKSGRYQEAIDHFKQVKHIKVEQAFSYYHGMAYAHYRLERFDDAQKLAEAARKYARGTMETSAAEEMLLALSSERARRAAAVPEPARQPRESPVTAAAAAEMVPGETKPALRRPEEHEEPKKLIRRSEPPEPPVTPPKAGIHGVLQQIDCLGKVARLRVLAERKHVSLAITDPRAVAIKGSSGGTLDLTCGPQKPRVVVLEYDSHPDAQLGTIGVVRSIEFQ